jgi:hypothetical protein
VQNTIHGKAKEKPLRKITRQRNQKKKGQSGLSVIAQGKHRRPKGIKETK